MARLGLSTLTPEECAVEARILLGIITSSDISSLSNRDRSFLDSQVAMAENVGYCPTPNQLFWLRDIKDKLL